MSGEPSNATEGMHSPAFETRHAVQDSQLHEAWTDYLTRYEHKRVNELALSWPEQKALCVDFRDVESCNPDLAEALLNAPSRCLRVGSAALHAMDVPVDPRPRPVLRVKGLPEEMVVLPRQLRSEHLGRLVPVEGIVQACDEVRNLPQEAAFECKFCSNIEHIVQEDDLLQEPVACSGCEKTGPWRLREEETTWIDSQVLIIQERPDQLRGGANPEARYVICRRDLVHNAMPGDHVIVNCIPATRVRRRGNVAKATEFETVLMAVSLEKPGDQYADTEITPEQRARYEEIARSGKALRVLVDSYAPYVHGWDDLKEALIFSLVGAPDRSSDNQMKVRGNIHVLLVGDPGVAKTQLVLEMEKCAPRCTVATGTTTSGAGLGAAATHDKTMGKWILEAGAAVLADEGVCVIDELGHMDPDDRRHLHTIMQEGIVRVIKAVKATLRANTTIVAAMNPPVGERFDAYQDIGSQIGVEAALLSRFDLVYCVQDRVDDGRDERVARMVLGRRNGIAAKLQERPLPVDDLRRYITLARSLRPHLTEEAVELLVGYYKKLRKATEDRPGITPRNVDGLARLAVASARIRLSEEATKSDAEAAIRLMEGSLESRGAIDEKGALDADVLVTGGSASQNDRMRLVLQAVVDLQRTHKNGYNRGWAMEDDVVDRCTTQFDMAEEQVRKALQTLQRNNTIYARGGAGTYARLAA